MDTKNFDVQINWYYAEDDDEILDTDLVISAIKEFLDSIDDNIIILT